MSEFPDRVVYVDDEQDLRTIMRDTFDACDYEGSFVTCATGGELMNRLRLLKPELILLDLLMPAPDGLETLENLRASEDGKDVSVIFMTGVNKLSMLEDYKHLGVIGIIHKPLNAETFMDQISEIWVESSQEE